MRHQFVVTCLAALGLGLLLGRGGTALAYNYNGLRWPYGTEMTTVCYYLTGSTSRLGLGNPLANAAQSWAAAGAKFRFSYTGSSACQVTVRNDKNGVPIKYGGSYVDAFSNSTVFEAGAVAGTWCTRVEGASGETRIARCKMKLKHGSQKDEYVFGSYHPNTGCYSSGGQVLIDTQSTGLHEFGHFLELKETSASADAMWSPQPECNGTKVWIHNVLSADDTAGIKYIYP